MLEKVKAPRPGGRATGLQTAQAGNLHSQFTPIPSEAAIAAACEELRPLDADWYIESIDTVRLAFAWLDAQKTRARRAGPWAPLKHVIENWAGRYVSTSAVKVAAHLHPNIRGQYPRFNLTAKFTRPSAERLRDIAEAGLHASSYQRDYSTLYGRQEKGVRYDG